MAYAAVFPGQGSQAVGMLQDFYETSNDCKSIFAEASDILNYDLWQLVSAGPKEKLNQTEFTQPALLTSSVAIYREFQKNYSNNAPKVMSGHSLGEYTALVAAGAIDFQSAVKLVQTRGRLMQSAVPEGTGAMLAILGLNDEKVSEACDASSESQILSPANFNSPGQVVVAGEKAAIERLSVIAKDMGAKRVVVLPVSVPSHCMMLKGAADEFKKKLISCDWRLPEVPVIHNRSAKVSSSVDEIINMLYEQLFSPVLWVDVVKNISSEVSTILEFGPGAVLTGLNKRIDKGVYCSAVNTIDSVSFELEKLK